MNHSTSLPGILATILIVGCASGPSGQVFDSALGEWKTRFTGLSGKSISPVMTIHDESRATYGFASGRVLFYEVDDQRRWEGFWVEDFGENMSCEEQQDGSHVWGVAVFRFNDVYNQFTGEWDACGYGKRYPWNGYR